MVTCSAQDMGPLFFHAKARPPYRNTCVSLQRKITEGGTIFSSPLLGTVLLGGEVSGSGPFPDDFNVFWYR